MLPTELRSAMRRALLVFALGAVASVGCNGTSGNDRFAFSARASGADVGAARTFTNDFGWTVSLARASMRLGPVYLNTVAPLRANRGFRLIREAHADEGHLRGGLVVGEVLSDVTVDLLGPPVPFPVAGLVTEDTVRTAEIRFWPGPGVDPETPVADPTLSVAGEATRDGVTVRFQGDLLLDGTWLPAAEPGDRNFLTLTDIRQVRGIPASFVASEGGTLTIKVDPRRLFATANFAQILNNPVSRTDAGVRLLVQSSGSAGTTDQVMRSLYDAVRSIRTYEVSWVPR